VVPRIRSWDDERVGYGNIGQGDVREKACQQKKKPGRWGPR
jgi:hypothetical protein